MLALTAVFVMLAELAVFVPSLAEFRQGWLNNRLAAARTAAVALEPSDRPLPPDIRAALLESVGARAVAIVAKGQPLLDVAREQPRPRAFHRYDPRTDTTAKAIGDAFATLLGDGDGVIVARDSMRPAAQGDAVSNVDIVAEVDEAPLREAMRAYAQGTLVATAILSLVVAALAMLALERMVLRPMRRLTSSLVSFARDPEDPAGLLSPSQAAHEMGEAERALASMQTALSRAFHERKRLAQLGLAVAKINHDLRNMLTSAQLVSDRLGTLDDPLARRLAPMLVATLDRATSFCRSTLVYGRASEHPPRVEPVELRPLAEEAAETVRATARGVEIVVATPAGFIAHADADHLYRILLNLVRNAADALHSAGPIEGESGRVTISAYALDATTDAIEVADNGPGVDLDSRAHLFEPFSASTRRGGTGLGLAIVAELARGHGGDVTLVDGPGAIFRVTLPRPPVATAA
jgi:signal transduction histidine kinase